jgi:hypothetical protein
METADSPFDFAQGNDSKKKQQQQGFAERKAESEEARPVRLSQV